MKKAFFSLGFLFNSSSPHERTHENLLSSTGPTISYVLIARAIALGALLLVLVLVLLLAIAIAIAMA